MTCFVQFIEPGTVVQIIVTAMISLLFLCSYARCQPCRGCGVEARLRLRLSWRPRT